MGPCPLIDQVLGTWRVHNRLNLYLLQRIPAEGFPAVPLGSRGRNVAQVFAHMDHSASPGCGTTRPGWWPPPDPCAWRR